MGEEVPPSKADAAMASSENPKDLSGGSSSDGSTASDEDLKKSNELHPLEIKDVPMRTFQFELGRNSEHPVSFNPLTSMIGIGILWGMSIWCMTSPEAALEALTNAKSQTTFYFTWLFIFSRPFFMFFVMYIGWKYGHIKLGPKDSKPEFSDVAYFSMLFSAGVAVGLFFFGVSEPLWFQQDNVFANQDYRTQDEIDQNAINQTLYHWGLAAWGSYLVVALAQGLGTFRFGLPMTFRASFYPLLGEYTWGWWGDFIDGFTLVTTVAGICTSLGLGAFQILAGLQRLGWVDPDQTEVQETRTLAVVVWCITLIATVSVISGLDVGIKYLSMFGFGLGLLLMFFVLALERTNYILNLSVQSIGYYLQWSIFQLNFWTDAFAQLPEGEGRAVDGQEAPAWFMNAWTVFYMAWWQSWSAFVGMFVARVSRGRTIGELTIYSFAAPFLYAVIWFCTFGGAGLRQARQALELKELGQLFFGTDAYFLADGSTYCYDVPQQDVMNGTDVIFTNSLLGITPVCEFNSAESNQAWFNVMYSFSFPNDGMEGFGSFMAGLSLFAVSIYFITSSDSGSLIVDHLASNGALNHHWVQRLFWAFTEGAVATALLLAGGSDALSALQAMSIVFGLPFTILVLWFCQSILRMCERLNELGESNEMQEYVLPKSFHMSIFGGLFNWMEYIVSIGNVHPERVALGMDKPSSLQSSQTIMAFFLPFVTLRRALLHVYPKAADAGYVKFVTVTYAVFHFLWIALFISAVTSRLFIAVAFAALFLNGCILTGIRTTVREQLNLQGDTFSDFLACSFLYFQVLAQLVSEYEEGSGAGNNGGGVEAGSGSVEVDL